LWVVICGVQWLNLSANIQPQNGVVKSFAINYFTPIVKLLN
jgi:hypothetical protein